MSSMIEQAKTFAIAAHSAVGQVRKYSGKPYWVHPIEVMETVSSVPHTEEMLAASLLHDVLEDTKVPFSIIKLLFGEVVANLVLELTDCAVPEDGNRATRVAINRAKSATTSPSAKTIRLADILSNCSSIQDLDPKFAKVYFAEKRQLLAVLTEGDETLFKRVHDMLYATAR